MSVSVSLAHRLSSGQRLYSFDRLVIGYCLLMVVLLLAVGRPLHQYLDEVIFYASMAALAAVVIRYVPEDAGGSARFVRLLYPGLMFTFFYRETGGMMFLLFDGFYDWQLTAFEKAVLGTNPTIYIDRNLLNVWANEIFSFGYSSYYLMIPVFLLTAFFKKDYQIVKSFLTAACLAFFCSYVLFFLYPIEGPRWHFAGEYVNGIEGPVFRRFTELMIEVGAVHGGCMPSSHFAVALVILMYCYKYYGRAGWAVLPLVLCLGIGTVWGRFHYVSDVLVGGIIGLISVLITWRYHLILPDQQLKTTGQKEPAPKNVS